MADERAGSQGKTIWILTGGRIGDLKQMQALASALSWPATVKRLVFRPPNIPFLANLLLDRGRSDPLGPPWPDLVFCSEALTSVIARSLRQKSGGAIKTVCLGRPAGSPAVFDLVLTTAQYRLPKTPQVIELGLPIATSRESGHSGPRSRGTRALARPVIAVLIGGTSLPEWLDRATATQLAEDLIAHARKTGGTLLVSTSPRTGEAAEAGLVTLTQPPHMLHLWRRGGDNPYRRFLADADEIVVTSDSVSMVADALGTGKPVSVYRLGQRHSLWHRIVEALYERAWIKPVFSPWMRPVKWLFDKGIIELRADRQLLFDRLVSEGRLRWFGDNGGAFGSLPTLTTEIDTAVARVRQLFPRYGR